MITSSWNAPATAFTDVAPLEGIHFQDVEKNADIVGDMESYQRHLSKIFTEEPVTA